MEIQRVLTVAGSDTSGGAGLQADLKTFEEYGTYGISVITSIVTMDPANFWHHDVFPIAESIIEKELATALACGPFKAMKTGMLGTVETIEQVSQMLETGAIEQIVIDPVMVCKGETEVLQPENVSSMRQLLIPKATITTPNLFEASQLAEMDPLETVEDMKVAAAKIIALGAKNVVIKGGKGLTSQEAIDLFYDGEEFMLLKSPKIEGNHNHGAGCTFAAAVTAGLANDLSAKEAVIKAKDFVYCGIEEGFALNQFIGPVWHGAYSRR
ncbi:bifunctional hydroxymethylpyrimidine kinase/phosphomethylpyrimidine kinase [Carnobacterium divergens]|uniref:bifunctional hydroxymethylpyrimidine kinase/phosphomethylpyrimidine kinase n=1 Tax=Carnobacterium divergens TaxID=2748 RepID=UPI00128CC4F2|nr:bifunctional hydroxymethylpyrimidine kinase/phosphomethylpyrimidine kinase [Carnobacterium divergens]MPQ23088.1 bifunctional hydroxymethylpyrimidine kinase/phosphomethylpyrimidine kinase [Carnobacterium divergens]